MTRSFFATSASILPRLTVEEGCNGALGLVLRLGKDHVTEAATIQFLEGASATQGFGVLTWRQSM